MFAAYKRVSTAYEVAINVHRCGGANQNQLAELERIAVEIEGM
jgi:hypothetical protein